jgi:hypothetical protein
MPVPVPDPAKSLELLFDYTKFHIGAYLTLAASFIAAASIKKGEQFALPINRSLALVAILLIMLAGLAGGVIISSITQCYAAECKSTTDLMKMPLGPWSSNILSGQWWVYIEHTSFWVGLLFSVLSFYVPTCQSAKPTPSPPLRVEASKSQPPEKTAG